MRKVNIYLENKEEGNEFCRIANTFADDVDLNCGSMNLDGKSALGMFCFAYPLKAEAVLISDNQEDIRRFDAVMEQFCKDRGGNL
nr:hypothetical protein [Clostridium sp. Marseille-P7770]